MTAPPTVGVILAGGRASRMGGGDKALLAIGGRPLLAHVIARLRPQVDRLLISAGGDPSRFASFGLTVIADALPGQRGPLAGILAALDWTARAAPPAGCVLSVPCDTPFLPHDLAARLHAARGADGSAVAIAASGGRRHPVIGLWPVGLASALRDRLAAGDSRVGAFAAAQAASVAEWPILPVDPFLNANTPDDLALARRLATES